MIPYGMFTPGEQELFNGLLAKSKTYLEWGMGNTTVLAIRSDIKKIVCVEGSDEFLKSWARTQSEITVAENKKRLRLLFADTAATGPYTDPADQFAKMGEAYAAPKGVRVPCDLVLIDGRFRVACAITAAILACPVVVIHDFSMRAHYQPVLEFFDVVKIVDSIAVLKPKKRINIKKALAMRVEYFKDPR